MHCSKSETLDEEARFVVGLRSQIGNMLGHRPVARWYLGQALTGLLPAPSKLGWAAGFIAMGVDAKAATTSGLAAHIVMVAVNALLSLCFVRALPRSAGR